MTRDIDDRAVTRPSAEHRRPGPLRVLLIADIRLYREGLGAVLERVEGMTVVALAADPGAGVEAARDANPDVIVVDAAMVAAQDALRDLAEASSGKLVALDVPLTEAAMVRYAEVGVVGYVTRDGSLEDVVRTIRAAGSGDVACGPNLTASLVRGVRAAAISTRRGAEPASSPASGTASTAATEACLTAREQEIAGLIADEGLTNREIAERLVIELPTVKNHVHNILAKLGVSRRSQAAARLRVHAPV